MNMDVTVTGCDDVNWIHLLQNTSQWGALVKEITNFPVQQKAWNFLT